MPETSPAQPSASVSSRREFLKTSAAAGVAGGVLANLSLQPHLYAAGSGILKVGLVGCGGRGTGAANQALQADPQTRLVAVGDTFPENIDRSLNSLLKVTEISDRIDISEENRFVGLDAYRHVIDACDVVLLASPPGFRPEHIAYAVEQGVHIFTEKPVATDAPGIRSVLESVRQAKEKNLKLLSGFCWRYHAGKQAFFQKILDGAIGEVLSIYATYLTSPVKPMPPASTRPAGMSDLEWQVRNWYNFTWLSGDGLVEQAVHCVDWIGWAQNDRPPASCVALGGRQIPAEGGDIYDHVQVNYLWENGTRGSIAQRQIDGCYKDYSCHIHGSKGQGKLGLKDHLIITADETWSFKGESPNMYQVEHDAFFKAIREDLEFNEGERLVNSTLMAMMGRMSAYSGKEITWEEALNSEERLVPATPDWNSPVTFRNPPSPGLTPFL